jgi:REP element-mobilizing transposase RayT
VTARGNTCQEVFLDDDDRNLFLSVLKQVVSRSHLLVHAYCLMGSHYHLLLVTPEGNLSEALRQRNGVYTQAFNRRTGASGLSCRDGSRRSRSSATPICRSCAATSCSTPCGRR